MRFPRWLMVCALLAAACGSPTPDQESNPALTSGPAVDGIVFVHGIAGAGSNWDPLIARFEQDGWPADRLIARSYANPSWGSNVDNAAQLAQWVQELRDRGAQHIAVVAHSMGGLSSRYYLQRLGGTASVEVFVTLGTMHHGLLSACLSPVAVTVWQELCLAGTFVTDLNTAPATPGPTRWISIFSSGDRIVSTESSRLQGAQNIEFEGIGHDGAEGFQRSAVVYQRLRESLGAP